MKWLFSKKSRRNGIRNHKNLFSNSTSQATRLIICSLVTGVFLCGDSDRFKLDLASPRAIAQRVNQIAANISVKILAPDFLGSGFLLGQTETSYFVVTNRHVLRGGAAPYKIAAPDGRVYTAEISSAITQDAYDLAVLTFETNAVYPTASIGSSQFLKVGEPIFAAGFPYEAMRANEPETELTLKLGRITTVLERALTEGYQIGYTNNVKKGMSGGPLLNSRGEVVGINGKHAYPLWESPEVYQDGSRPCPALQELITRSSLAIPIEKSIELTPQLELPPTTTNSEVALPVNDPQLVNRMQTEAQRTHRKCENYTD